MRGKKQKYLAVFLASMMVAGSTVTSYAAGWEKNGGTWVYEKEDQTILKAQWFQDRDGNWYHFDADGTMQTGWFRDLDGRYYYLNTAADGIEGAMRTGWFRDANGSWYYLNPISDGTKGSMQTGWITVDGKRWYLNGSGAWNGKAGIEISDDSDSSDSESADRPQKPEEPDKPDVNSCVYVGDPAKPEGWSRNDSGVYLVTGGSYEQVTVTDFVGNGSVVIEDTVMRDLIINGGGAGSVRLKGEAKVTGEVRMAKQQKGSAQPPRLEISDTVSVGNVLISEKAIVESVSKTAVFVNIDAKADLLVQGASTIVETLTSKNGGAVSIADGLVKNLVMSNTSSVTGSGQASVEEARITGSLFAKDIPIHTVYAGENTQIEGSGDTRIDKLIVTTGSSASIDGMVVDHVEAAQGATVETTESGAIGTLKAEGDLTVARGSVGTVVAMGEESQIEVGRGAVVGTVETSRNLSIAGGGTVTHVAAAENVDVNTNGMEVQPPIQTVTFLSEVETQTVSVEFGGEIPELLRRYTVSGSRASVKEDGEAFAVWPVYSFTSRQAGTYELTGSWAALPSEVRAGDQQPRAVITVEEAPKAELAFHVTDGSVGLTGYDIILNGGEVFGLKNGTATVWAGRDYDYVVTKNGYISASGSITGASDRTVNVVLSKAEVKSQLTFDLSGVTAGDIMGVVPEDGMYTEGTRIPLPVGLRKAGYNLVWTLDGNTVTEAVAGKTAAVYRAREELIEYTIQYAGAFVDSAPVSYDVTTGAITLPTQVRAPEGYDFKVFKGWYTTAAFAGQPVTQIPAGSTGNKTFYAKFGYPEDTVAVVKDVDGNISIHSKLGEALEAASSGGLLELEKDVDLSGEVLNDGFLTKTTFKGTMDGKGHILYNPPEDMDMLYWTLDATLKNIRIQPGGHPLALVNLTYGNTVLKNITVLPFKEGESLEVGTNISFFAAHAMRGTLTFENCVNQASYSMKEYAGIFLGGFINEYCEGVTFRNCVNEGQVRGKHAAFFVGNPTHGTTINQDNIIVEGCRNEGTLTGVLTANYFSEFSTGYEALNQKISQSPSMFTGNPPVVNYGEIDITEENGVFTIGSYEGATKYVISQKAYAHNSASGSTWLISIEHEVTPGTTDVRNLRIRSKEDGETVTGNQVTSTSPAIAYGYDDTGCCYIVSEMRANNEIFTLTGNEEVMVSALAYNGDYLVAVSEYKGEQPPKHGVNMTVTTADQLKKAVEGANSGATVRLGSDLVIDTADGIVTVPDGVELTLDLNGKSITVGKQFSGRPIVNNGSLTVTGKGTIDSSASEVSGSSGETSGGYGAINNFGDLKIENGTYRGHLYSNGSAIANRSGGTVVIEDGYFYSTCAFFNFEGASATINGGHFDGGLSNPNIDTNNPIRGGWCYTIRNNGDLVIYDAEVTGGQGAISIDSGTLEVHGGRFEPRDFYGLYVSNDGSGTDPKPAMVKVTGGEFKGGSVSGGHSVLLGSDVNNPVNSVLEIQDGTFHGTVHAQANAEVNAIIIIGGKFEKKPLDTGNCIKLPDGKGWVETETGWWTVGELPVTLQEMIPFEVKVGETIDLMEELGITNGLTEEEIGKITWESSDSDIASVSESGIVTGVKEGEAEITIELDGYSMKAEVLVLEKEIPEVCEHKFAADGEAMTLEPTCTEEGSITRICTECGKEVEEVLEPLGHEFGADGICVRCGELKEEEDKALPGELPEHDLAVEAGGNAGGGQPADERENPENGQLDGEGELPKDDPANDPAFSEGDGSSDDSALNEEEGSKNDPALNEGDSSKNDPALNEGDGSANDPALNEGGVLESDPSINEGEDLKEDPPFDDGESTTDQTPDAGEQPGTPKDDPAAVEGGSEKQEDQTLTGGDADKKGNEGKGASQEELPAEEKGIILKEGTENE